MTLEHRKLLDDIGWQLLEELQQDARLSYSDLGKRVGLTSPAVADRIRKMEEAGIITGYHAEIDAAKIGLPVLAIIRLSDIGGVSCREAANRASEIPEVIECYRVTGNDSIVVKAIAHSVEHLAKVIDKLSMYGVPSASIVRSAPRKRRTIPRKMIHAAEGWDD